MRLTINKVGFLYYLQHEINKQHSQMKIAVGNLDRWSKWHYLIESDLSFIKKANNRTILSNEVVIDLDINLDLDSKKTDDLIKYACDFLNSLGLKYDVYFSGSRGIHIHAFIFDYRFFHLPKWKRDEFRQRILEKIPFADKQKKEDTMIAMEFTPHWKTGTTKRWLSKYSTLNLPLKYYKELKEVIS